MAFVETNYTAPNVCRFPTRWRSLYHFYKILIDRVQGSHDLVFEYAQQPGVFTISRCQDLFQMYVMINESSGPTWRHNFVFVVISLKITVGICIFFLFYLIYAQSAIVLIVECTILKKSVFQNFLTIGLVFETLSKYY